MAQRQARRMQIENDLATTRAFYEKRRIRQQYLDEQRDRRRLTEVDVAALREHRNAVREIIESTGNLPTIVPAG